MIGENKYMVGVCCTTYNHHGYIQNAMDGFSMQQTTFPYIVIIVDDASTDGEQEVIDSYIMNNFEVSPKSEYKNWATEDAYWTFARHKENTNCFFLAIYLKTNLFRDDKKDFLIKEWFDAKYIALCEGDDYWTDPKKLQKQVDFLEEHPDFSMCIHGADVKKEASRPVWTKCEAVETREYFPEDVFPEWVVPTASIIYRKESFMNYPIKHFDWFVARDIVYIMIGMHTGRVWGMADHMSVYRMNEGSLMAKSYHETVESRQALCRHYQALMMNFPQVDKEYCNHYIASFNYSRFRLEKKWTVKLNHLFIAINASPKYVYRKFWRAVTNGKENNVE